jgi:hypothetical protein
VRKSFCLLHHTPRSNSIYACMRLFQFLRADRAWTWFSRGIMCRILGYAVLPFFGPSPNITSYPPFVQFMIHPFHQARYFGSAVHLEFVGSGSNWFSELRTKLGTKPRIGHLETASSPFCRYFSGRSSRIWTSRRCLDGNVVDVISRIAIRLFESSKLAM